MEVISRYKLLFVLLLLISCKPAEDDILKVYSSLLEWRNRFIDEKNNYREPDEQDYRDLYEIHKAFQQYQDPKHIGSYCQVRVGLYCIYGEYQPAYEYLSILERSGIYDDTKYVLERLRAEVALRESIDFGNDADIDNAIHNIISSYADEFRSTGEIVLIYLILDELCSAQPEVREEDWVDDWTGTLKISLDSLMNQCNSVTHKRTDEMEEFLLIANKARSAIREPYLP